MRECGSDSSGSGFGLVAQLIKNVEFSCQLGDRFLRRTLSRYDVFTTKKYHDWNGEVLHLVESNYNVEFRPQQFYPSSGLSL